LQVSCPVVEHVACAAELFHSLTSCQKVSLSNSHLNSFSGFSQAAAHNLHVMPSHCCTKLQLSLDICCKLLLLRRRLLHDLLQLSERDQLRAALKLHPAASCRCQDTICCDLYWLNWTVSHGLDSMLSLLAQILVSLLLQTRSDAS